MNPRQPMSTLLWGDRRQILKLIGLLLTQTQSQLHLALASSVFDAKVNGRTRWHLRELVIECGVGRCSIDGNHAVSCGDPSPVGIPVRINLNDFWLASQVRRGGEPRRSYWHSLVDHMQTRQLKKAVVGNLLHARYVVAKELCKALPRNRLRRLLHTLRVGKEAVLLGVVFVHPLQQIAQRFFPMRDLADPQVKQDTEDLALVVVADATLRRAIVRLTFKPGVKARLFGRLPMVRGTPLQFCNFLRDALQIYFLIDQSRAHQQHVSHCAGYSLTEPESAGEVRALVVDRLQRLRPNPLHVPQMEELMRAHTRQRQQRLT